MSLIVASGNSNSITLFSVPTNQDNAGKKLFKVVLGDGLKRPDFSSINDQMKNGNIVGVVSSDSDLSFNLSSHPVSDSSCPVTPERPLKRFKL